MDKKRIGEYLKKLRQQKKKGGEKVSRKAI